MFNLNKIIYTLLICLLLELGVLAIYSAISESSSESHAITKIFEVVNTAKYEPLPILKIKSPIIKEAEQVKSHTLIKPKRIKSLEDVLVHVSPHRKSDIISIQNQMVQPIIYTKSIKLTEMSIENKKQTFINMMIPSILVAKHRIKEERKKVLKLLRQEHISKKDDLWLRKKRYIFKASTVDELYERMELHPTSIVIAQAIIESGWGTSRFFEQANNVFGIWSFNEHEKRIAASKKRGDKTIYLKKYKDVEQSISDYFLLLSTKDAYKEFREKRLESQDPFILIEQLGKYSELGEAYIENLKNTIEENQLLAYDSYSLDI